jgi:hypothetical protein
MKADNHDMVGHMKYLEEQGLEAAVSAALMQAINERAPDGRRRVAELLMGSAPPAGLQRARAQNEASRMELNEMTASWEAERAQLKSQLEAMRAQLGSAPAAPAAVTARLPSATGHKYREMMARLFLVLDADQSGSLDVPEVRAFIMALARGAAASAEPEQLATRSFIAVLEQLLEGRASISRWHLPITPAP